MVASEPVCSRCVMDRTATNIAFDQNSICNYCRHYEQVLAAHQREDRKQRLNELTLRVKSAGHGKPYDCIVGMSGGIDSAYALYLAKKQGLRPLAVHMDNGWDSELAASNIENLVRKLGVDLHTYVINWQEYKRLMQAFFDADVIDVELLYDNAMLAVNYQLAAKHGLRWILAGSNTATEGMQMPSSWSWFKYDKKNIQALAKTAGVRLRTFPALGTKEFVYYGYVRRTQWVPFLDYIDYIKADCAKVLVNELGYRTYPYKHGESVFTRFYQGYILPEKFGIDKRKIHFSTLIMSGQLDRAAALEKLQEPPYAVASELQADIDYFLKKMGWSRSQLDAYIARPEQPHAKYGTEKPLWDRLVKAARTVGIVARRPRLSSA